MVKIVRNIQCVGGYLMVILAVVTNVETQPTAQDIEVFTELGLQGLHAGRSFEQEITLLRKVQTVVFKHAPFGEGIPEFESREPADLMRYGKGKCFDRNRTFEKAFTYISLPSRDMYLLYRENRSLLNALFRYGQSSHAVTEVKTSRGWMYVDSNAEWIALTRKNEPVGADDVSKRIAEFDHAQPYLAEPWWAIRGLYSRKGQFYSPYIPFPDMYWRDLGEWLIGSV